MADEGRDDDAAAHGARMAGGVWKVASQCYGRAWAREYGAQPPRAWQRAMEALSEDEVRHGLAAMARGRWTFPPNLAEFREACRPHSTATPEQRALYGRIDDEEQHPALPSMTQLATRTATGKRWLALCYLDGILPRPEGVTMDTLDDWLGDADLETMRAQVRSELESIRKRMVPRT